jgi:BlaI family penicillinase repressor
MGKDTGRQPAPAELLILRILWEHGPGTVAEVHAQLQQHSAVGYTTVLKSLQVMARKGLVQRDESARAHVYTAAEPEAATQKRLLKDLLFRAFPGSTQQLVLRALEVRKLSREERREIRDLLDQLEEKDQ